MWKLGSALLMFSCYGKNCFNKMKEYGIDCVDIHLNPYDR